MRRLPYLLLLVCALYSVGVLAQSGEGMSTTTTTLGLQVPPGTQALSWPAALVVAAWYVGRTLTAWGTGLRELAVALKSWTPTIRVEHCAKDPTGPVRIP